MSYKAFDIICCYINKIYHLNIFYDVIGMCELKDHFESSSLPVLIHPTPQAHDFASLPSSSFPYAHASSLFHSSRRQTYVFMTWTRVNCRGPRPTGEIYWV